MSDPNKKIPIIELFGPTFQGEGALCGTQTYFLRTGLCDYKCTMCDSMHAVDPNQVKHLASWQTPAEVMQSFHDHVRRQDALELAPWMTLTGGNPCIHDLTILVQELQAEGIKVNVETQGTLCPPWLMNVDLVTISPKSPGMGERFDEDLFRNMLRMCLANTQIAVKVVIFSQIDLEFAHLVFSIFDAEVNAYVDEELDEPFVGKYLSLGNPFPPQHPNLSALAFNKGLSGKALDDSLKVALLDEFRSLCEDILKDNRFRDVVFLPQLHVLTWANLQKV